MYFNVETQECFLRQRDDTVRMSAVLSISAS